jgi:hypothetical protein
MGLLDDLGSFIKTPEGQGLLSAAFGGMAGAKPGQPWNTAGRAGLAGLLGYQNAQENQYQQQFEDMKLKTLREQMETQERMRAAAKNSMLSPEQVTLLNGQGPTVANAAKIGSTAPQFDQQGFMSQLWGIDPLQAMQMQQNMAKQTPFGKVDPKDYTPESLAKFAQTRNHADLVAVRERKITPAGQVFDPYAIQPGQVFADPNKPFSIGPDGTFMPNLPYQAYSKEKARAGASSVSVNTKQETEEAKTVGRGFGEMFVDLQRGDQSASSKIARLDRLEQLLDGVNTGKLAAVGTDISALAASIGFNIDPKLGNKQAAEALSNEIALQMRNPSGGAGMPGALSDKDREFLVKTTPGITKDSTANAMIIGTMKKLAQREKDVARIARDYRMRKGTLDEGFYEELERFANANPLFEGEVLPKSGNGWSIRPVNN